MYLRAPPPFITHLHKFESIFNCICNVEKKNVLALQKPTNPILEFFIAGASSFVGMKIHNFTICALVIQRLANWISANSLIEGKVFLFWSLKFFVCTFCS
jgi:hypothetical protein